MTKPPQALTPKQKRFISEYLVDLNGTQAAIRAGYSQRTANEQAARLLAKASVKAAVRAGTAKQIEKAELSAARVLEELRRLAFFDPGELYDKHGHLLPIQQMPPEVRAALTGQKVARANLDRTDGKRSKEWLHEIKYADKAKALEMLAKHYKLLTEIHEHKGEWDKLAARIASARAK